MARKFKKDYTFTTLSEPPSELLPLWDLGVGCPKRPWIPLEDGQAYIDQGYEVPISRDGTKCYPPTCRRGVARKVGDEWWESTLIDGVLVPVKSAWLKIAIALYQQPEVFRGRKTCGVPITSGGKVIAWCQEPLDNKKCNHCSGWSIRSARACRLTRIEGFTTCRYHSASNISPPGDADSIFAQETLRKAEKEWLKEGYRKAMSPALRAMVKGFKGSPTDLSPEIELQRAMFEGMVKNMGNTDAALMAAREKWNEFATAKGAENAEKALREVGKIIQNGVDDVAKMRELRKASESLGRLIGTQGKLELDRQSVVTEKQLWVFVEYLMGLTRDLILEQTMSPMQKITVFSEKMKELIGRGDRLITEEEAKVQVISATSVPDEKF